MELWKIEMSAAFQSNEYLLICVKFIERMLEGKQCLISVRLVLRQIYEIEQSPTHLENLLMLSHAN